jgi:putative endonuclease
MPVVQSMANVTSRWRARLFGEKDFSDPRHAAGDRAEKLAAKFLRKNGYKILYRNFKPTKYGRGGQIDLVCRDDETLVFVEVKSLRSDERQRPLDHLKPSQQRRISQGALTWLRLLNNPDISFRFDVVEVVFNEDAAAELQLVQDAFQLSKPYIY